ncbi:MAG: hypothetical protein LBT79_02795 [Elusimicrobiota bacterium]|jgi:hypothetical protein|nr:hypothetical protein [Elusimicrobiota bacterium]
MTKKAEKATNGHYITQVEIVKKHAKEKGITLTKDILEAAKCIDGMRSIIKEYKINAFQDFMNSKR